MPILLLDLDQTCFTISDTIQDLEGQIYTPEDEIHKKQVLSKKTYHAQIGDYYSNIKIINPNKLAKLLEMASEFNSTIIYITSGGWHPSVRDIFANNLSLSAKAQKMVVEGEMHNAYDDARWYNNDVATTINASKGERLMHIINENPEKYRNKSFVALDDSSEQLDTYRKLNFVRTVEATTFTSETKFYDLTENALLCGYFEENEREQVILPPNKRAISRIAGGIFLPEAKKLKISTDSESTNSLEKNPQEENEEGTIQYHF